MWLNCWWMSNRLWNVDWVVDECWTDYKMWVELLMGMLMFWNDLFEDDILLRCDCWLASTNGIQDGRPGCDWWLASANSIRDGWPGCDWWLASTNGIKINDWVLFDD